MTCRMCCVVFVVVWALGCTESKPKGDLPPLFPTKGKVLRGTAPVQGGSIRFVLTPETPESRDLLIVGEVGQDGSFELSTLHSISQKKALGAPTGNYQATFTSAIGDQTQGGQVQIITPSTTFTVKSEPTDLTVDLSKK